MDSVSLHLDIVSKNFAGAVFSSPAAKVAVVRWSDQSNLAQMLELLEHAFSEMATAEADALIYDMRAIPHQESLTNDIIARLQCHKSNVVRCVALLTAGSDTAGHPAVTWAAKEQGVHIVVANSFQEGAVALDKLRAARGALLIAGHRPEEFHATYAGSFYFISELGATVIRTSGHISQPAKSSELVQAAFSMHKRRAGTTLIIDSSASPPITDMARYIQVYQQFIVPIGTSGMFRQAVHVRTGEPIFPEGAPPVAPLVTSFGVPFYEVNLMYEAISLLHTLKGVRQSIPGTAPGWEAK